MLSPLPAYVTAEARRRCVSPPKTFGRIAAQTVDQARQVRRFVAAAVRSDCRGRRALRAAVTHFEDNRAAFSK